MTLSTCSLFGTQFHTDSQFWCTRHDVSPLRTQDTTECNVVGDQTGFNCIVQSEVIMYTGFKCRVNVLGDETESKCRV
jgi:hypothetical protein